MEWSAVFPNISWSVIYDILSKNLLQKIVCCISRYCTQTENVLIQLTHFVAYQNEMNCFTTLLMEMKSGYHAPICDKGAANALVMNEELLANFWRQIILLIKLLNCGNIVNVNETQTSYSKQNIWDAVQWSCDLLITYIQQIKQFENFPSSNFTRKSSTFHHSPGNYQCRETMSKCVEIYVDYIEK